MKCDLHLHSHHSIDSNSKLMNILEEARRKGISVIAITDHNNTNIFREIDAVKTDIYIIKGCEFSTELGHISGLFLNTPIEASGLERNCRGVYDSQAVLRFIKAEGGISVLCHPYRNKVKPRDEKFYNQFDLVEAYNGRSGYTRHGCLNGPAYEDCMKYKLQVSAGSDGHMHREVGTTYIEYDVEQVANIEELKEVLRTNQGRIVGQPTPMHYDARTRIYKAWRTRDSIGILKNMVKLILSLIYPYIQEKPLVLK